ncbi:hypothetical protein F183_A29750 [Bryobacterales bacterium F-183]|nr:hypothetical protein F183_A29750 [Bryobacterales bacterium F-183]
MTSIDCQRIKPATSSALVHTINRGGVQPCSVCRRDDHAHLVPDSTSGRIWTIYCEAHCPVCAEARAARLRALLTVLAPAEDPETPMAHKEAA